MSRRLLAVAGASAIAAASLMGAPGSAVGADQADATRVRASGSEPAGGDPRVRASGSEPAGGDPRVLTVDVSRSFKDVDHAASGALYGLGDEGWPPDGWIAPTRPKMFTQPPPGATHLPNEEPEPVGDTLDVWPVASRHGASVTVRLPDIFPTFPYQWLGDDYWYEQVEAMVGAVVDSGADNIYGYEIWNEPQWTWNPEWGDYFEMWERTYHLIRELDADTPIIGPSYDRDYEDGLREFMTFAVESGTVPDIVSWHELGPVEGLNVGEHVAFYRELERELGVEPRPISINEYGSPRDAGVPGWLARFVARMERAEVDTANLAFWHKPGRLADLLVPRGGGSGPATDPEPTGNYWLFDWYGDMTGSMVQTVPPADAGRYIEVGDPVPAPSTRSPAQDGFGNALRLGDPEPNEYVELPEGIVGDLDDATIATWVNWDGAQTWARIFDFGSGTATYMFLTPDAGGADGLRLDMADGSGTVQQLASPQELPTGWQHVAVTLDGDTATLWLNGEPLASGDAFTLNPSDMGITTQNWIGQSQFGADPRLHAMVDELQIYDRALGQDEIRSLMTSPGGDPGGGNVAWYRFDEDGGTAAADASGNGRDATVSTAVTGVELIPIVEGFASADPDTRTVRVVFGGGEGDIQLKIDGLRTLRGFGARANVQVFTTEWTGTDGVSAGPMALFEGEYPAHRGSISVPVAGLNESDAYLALVTPVADAPDLAGPARRHEAEDAGRGASGWVAGTHPLASSNRYVTPRRTGGGQLRFTVDAPAAGAYDLGIRYTNATGSAVSGAVVVNGAPGEVVELQPTGPDAAFATHGTLVVLDEGRNDIRIALDSRAAGLDYIEVTPFRARFEAEDGQWSGASRVRVDMSEGNFFANYFSGFAYVRDLSQADSYLELPVTVPAAGTYDLTIGYSTAGSQESRRAQIPALQVLRVDDGPWQEVTYAPTQFREMIRQTTATVELPAGTSTITLAKNHPDYPGETQPGTVDLDYIDVELLHRQPGGASRRDAS